MTIRTNSHYLTAKMFLKRLLLTVAVVSLCSFGYAQEDGIDLFLKDKMQKGNIPGAQLAVVRNGVIVKLGNYGLANVQDSIPVKTNTVFTLNSITKAFVGVAIMQLVEGDKLNLSFPISTYLNDLPAAWGTVTTQQLLSHTSGLPDIVDEETNLISTEGEEASWKKVQALPMEFKPGEMFRYNQTNYLLLGRILDKLSGMPFAEFITKEQLKVVGMPNTVRAGFGGSGDVIARSAGAYRSKKGKLMNMYFSLPPSLQTAAGMHGTAKEIADWVIALQNKELLKKETSLKALWTPAVLNNGKTGGFSRLLNGYAAGWPTAGRAEHPAAAAVGGNRSAIFVYPEDNLSIILLTNLAGAFPDSFMDELAGFYIPDMKESNGFGLSPSVKLLRTKLEKTGYKKAIPQTKGLAKSSKGFVLTESEVNDWGYTLLKQNRTADALEIFKLNVSLYTNSGNAFDSLGEVYAEIGDKEQAIKNYEQAVKLNPKNENAIAVLKLLKSK